MARNDEPVRDMKGNINLPNASGEADPRLSAPAAPARSPRSRLPVERPLMDYDKGRATRELSRPLSKGRR